MNAKFILSTRIIPTLFTRKRCPVSSRLWLVAAMALVARVPETPAAERSGPGPDPVQAVSLIEEEVYRVDFEEPIGRRTRRDLRDISITYALRRRPVPSRVTLERRARRDLVRFAAYFRNAGYFAPQFGVEVEEVKARPRVAFRIEPGALYRIGVIRVETDSPGAMIPGQAELPLAVGDVAVAGRIADTASTVVGWYQDRGHPHAAAGRVQLEVTHADQRVDVMLPVTLGPAARVGDISISGLRRVQPELVHRRLRLRKGDAYARSELDRSRDHLRGTGLFSTVRLEPGPALDPSGRVPILLEVTERRFRTVKFGVNYLTDLGFGGQAGFQHRNLRGRGDVLEFALPVSESGFAVESSYRIPDFLREDQVLSLRGMTGVEDTDAYEARRVTVGAALARPLTEAIRASSGVDYSLEKVTQQGAESTFQLFAFPQAVSRDTSDGLLAPGRGTVLRVETIPYLNIREISDAFLKTTAGARAYVPLLRQPHTILALRLRLGAISGTSRDATPATVRYYAGGGGSIRGFEYQTVGPLVDGQPVGGRSLLESSVEFRVQATTRIGLVAFVDAGTAAEDWRPARGETVRVGAGGGLRYRTPIGPLRFDAATPVNERAGIDDEVEFYLSIGHAF